MEIAVRGVRPVPLLGEGDMDEPPVHRAFFLFHIPFFDKLVNGRGDRRRADAQAFRDFSDGFSLCVLPPFPYRFQKMNFADGKVQMLRSLQHLLLYLLNGTICLYKKLIQFLFQRVHSSVPFSSKSQNN